jgi:hypothetical protein
LAGRIRFAVDDDDDWRWETKRLTCFVK